MMPNRLNQFNLAPQLKPYLIQKLNQTNFLYDQIAQCFADQLKQFDLDHKPDKPALLSLAATALEQLINQYRIAIPDYRQHDFEIALTIIQQNMVNRYQRLLDNYLLTKKKFRFKHLRVHRSIAALEQTWSPKLLIDAKDYVAWDIETQFECLEAQKQLKQLL